MSIETHIKNTPMLLLFALLFIIIFGFWLRKRIISFDFKNRSKFFFFLDNYELICGVLVGIGLLFLVIFL
jgi:hypothetical protein